MGKPGADHYRKSQSEGDMGEESMDRDTERPEPPVCVYTGAGLVSVTERNRPRLDVQSRDVSTVQPSCGPFNPLCPGNAAFTLHTSVEG